MKAEIKQLWVAALRSGEYQQTEGQLRNGDQMCCLGVLCDLATKAGIGQWDGNEFLTIEGENVVGVDAQLPSEFVRDWAGLPSTSPEIGEGPLTDMNDGINGFEQSNFAQIADMIEEYL